MLLHGRGQRSPASPSFGGEGVHMKSDSVQHKRVSDLQRKEGVVKIFHASHPCQREKTEECPPWPGLSLN